MTVGTGSYLNADIHLVWLSVMYIAVQCSVVLGSTDARHRLGTSSCISMLDMWTPWTLGHIFVVCFWQQWRCKAYNWYAFSEWNRDIKPSGSIRYITNSGPFYCSVITYCPFLNNTITKYLFHCSSCTWNIVMTQTNQELKHTAV